MRSYTQNIGWKIEFKMQRCRLDTFGNYPSCHITCQYIIQIRFLHRISTNISTEDQLWGAIAFDSSMEKLGDLQLRFPQRKPHLYDNDTQTDVLFLHTGFRSL